MMLWHDRDNGLTVLTLSFHEEHKCSNKVKEQPYIVCIIITEKLRIIFQLCEATRCEVMQMSATNYMLTLKMESCSSVLYKSTLKYT